MQNAAIYVIPLAILLILGMGFLKKVKMFDAFLQGAGEGVSSTFSIMPALIGLITAVSMLKASGVIDIFSNFLSNFFDKLGIPSEILSLALLRPVSGSGSIALVNNIFTNFGVDSFIGRVASVVMGSTETAFYVIAVYFGAVGIKNTRHVLPSALLADFASLIFSVLAVRLFFR